MCDNGSANGPTHSLTPPPFRHPDDANRDDTCRKCAQTIRGLNYGKGCDTCAMKKEPEMCTPLRQFRLKEVHHLLGGNVIKLQERHLVIKEGKRRFVWKDLPQVSFLTPDEEPGLLITDRSTN